jgi:cell wall-associated NlpC family hydrolase
MRFPSSVPALAVTALLLIGTAVPARADDAPTTVAGLLTHYLDLGHEAEAVNEQLLGAQDDLTAAQQAARTANAAAAAATQRWQQAQGVADGRAASEQRLVALLATTRGDDPLRDLLLTGDVGRFRAAADAGLLAGFTDDSALREADVEATGAATLRQQAATREAAAAAAESKAQAAADAVRTRRDALAGKISAVRAALDAIPADQKSLLQTDAAAPAGPVTVPAGAVGTILAFALAQLGKPYVWGATGPDSYDCSGLVQTSYAAAGVRIPRVSAAQARVGRVVGRAEVRAGDLIFFYRPVQHVALALDGTQAVQAATFGQPVKISPIDAIGPITVIRRLLP